MALLLIIALSILFIHFMKLKLAFGFFAVALDLTTASLAFAQDVKDGRPCVSGICIGDDISALSGVKWDTATMFRQPVKLGRLSESDQKRLTERFAPASKAAVIAAAPYLQFERFDNEAIPKLAKVVGYCSRLPTPLSGEFKSESGYLTTVAVNVVPGEHPAEQALRVEYIKRVFPERLTKAQLNELEGQLAARYAGVKRGVDGKVSSWDFKTYTRELTLQRAYDKRIAQAGDLLKGYPGCGTALKLD